MKLDYKGGALFYEDTGTGKTCVLLHGFLENRQMWQPLVDAVSDRCQLIAIDLPGHGESSVLREETTMESLSASVKFVLDRLGIDTVSIIGHSMGGYVGLAFAKAYASQIDGLLLLNSTPEADDEVRKEVREHGISLARKNYRAVVSMSIANMFPRESARFLKKEIDLLKIEALKTPVEGYIAFQKAMMARGDSSDFLAKAKFKRAMVLGSKDALIDAGHLKEYSDRSGIYFSLLRGGHMLLTEAPKNTLSKLISFLRIDGLKVY